MDTANWECAIDLVRKWESQGQISTPERQAPTIREACDAFLAEKEIHGIKNSTSRMYKIVCRELVSYCLGQGIPSINAITLADLQGFRRSWKDLAPSTVWVKSTKVVVLFKFFQTHKWVADGVIDGFSIPPLRYAPTMPFTREEMDSILAACSRLKWNKNTGERAEAFVLLLRYSGLRIGDAATLHSARLHGDSISLTQQKTGMPVYVPIPKFVSDKLRALKPAGGYYFHNGRTNVEDTPKYAALWLKRIFTEAGITGGHAHRFRDTFAVELLNAGVPIEDVSTLLGHKSIQTTERSYAPWVKSRQDRMEERVRAVYGEGTTHIPHAAF